MSVFTQNPNTQHQVWSLWTYTVRPGDRTKTPSKAEVSLLCAQFAVKVFGSTGQAQIDRQFNAIHGAWWVLKFRVEGDAVRDPGKRLFIGKQWARFFAEHFGVGTHTHQDTKFEAGDKQDGSPREQLIIMPAENFRQLAREDL